MHTFFDDNKAEAFGYACDDQGVMYCKEVVEDENGLPVILYHCTRTVWCNTNFRMAYEERLAENRRVVDDEQ